MDPQANRKAVEAQVRRKLGSLAKGSAGRKRVAGALKRAVCARYVSRGSIRRSAKTGANAVAFTGRVGKRALALGAHRVAVTARDGTGPNSPVARASFVIVKR